MVMTTVERFERIMDFKPVDCIPMIEWAPYWEETINRWQQEGLSSNLANADDVRRYFGFDSYRQLWINPRSQYCPVSRHHGVPLIGNRQDYLRLKPRLFPKPAFDAQTLALWCRV